MSAGRKDPRSESLLGSRQAANQKNAQFSNSPVTEKGKLGRAHVRLRIENLEIVAHDEAGADRGPTGQAKEFCCVVQPRAATRQRAKDSPLRQNLNPVEPIRCGSGIRLGRRTADGDDIAREIGPTRRRQIRLVLHSISAVADCGPGDYHIWFTGTRERKQQRGGWDNGQRAGVERDDIVDAGQAARCDKVAADVLTSDTA